MLSTKGEGEKTAVVAVSATTACSTLDEQHLDPCSALANNWSCQCGAQLWLPITFPALECLDLAVITAQQPSCSSRARAAVHLPSTFSHTAFHPGSYCHETLDVLGSLILVTQSRSVFLEGVSRCPWQHFSWQCCRIAIQEDLVVLCILICCWKIWLFLIFYLYLASGVAWMRQRETFAPMNGLWSRRLPLGNWISSTNSS